jgi:hypothetical protein
MFNTVLPHHLPRSVRLCDLSCTCQSPSGVDKFAIKQGSTVEVIVDLHNPAHSHRHRLCDRISHRRHKLWSKLLKKLRVQDVVSRRMRVIVVKELDFECLNLLTRQDQVAKRKADAIRPIFELFGSALERDLWYAQPNFDFSSLGNVPRC